MVFDTTDESIAKKNNLHSEKAVYTPSAICVGEKQILPGLDEQLEGKEIGKHYTVKLQSEKAFGKRDIKKMRIVSMSTFKEHDVQPQSGLQIDVDGELGIIARISGGRIIVNFNHPLAGKEVTDEFVMRRKITETAEKITAFFHTLFKIPQEQITVEIKEGQAAVKIPVAFPHEIAEAIGKKVTELVTEVKSIEIKAAKEEKTSS